MGEEEGEEEEVGGRGGKMMEEEGGGGGRRREVKGGEDTNAKLRISRVARGSIPGKPSYALSSPSILWKGGGQGKEEEER